MRAGVTLSWASESGHSRPEGHAGRRSERRRLERNHERHLGIRVAARFVLRRVAIEVGLIDSADADMGVAPGVEINAGAGARGVQVRQVLCIGAAIKAPM